MLKRYWMQSSLVLMLTFLAHTIALAHTQGLLSVHDAVDGALKRLKASVPKHQLPSLTPEAALHFLTPEQKSALSSQYIRFTVNQPVIVSVARDIRWGQEPFWLTSSGFLQTNKTFKEAGTIFDVWEKRFETGEVGLGVNSLTGGGIHYVVAIRPLEPNPSSSLEISHVFPKKIKLHQPNQPLQPFVDNNYVLKKMPEGLDGRLVQLVYERRKLGKILNILHHTKFPARDAPDQWRLTWSMDPRTTQTLQWRSSTNIHNMSIRAVKYDDPLAFNSQFHQTLEVKASLLETPTIVNDPKVHHYQASFVGLEPGMEYRYGYKDPEKKKWLEVGVFRTAPDSAEDFSFMYLGDAQNGLTAWGDLIKGASKRYPDARFILMAGDLVDRGNDRDDWDHFFAAAGSVFANQTLVPVIGNHENQGGHPTLYLSLFDLLKNGPKEITQERAYSFEYGHALFIVLDTNIALASQTSWLKQTLSSSKAHWKFVSFHHPAYPSSDRSVDPSFATQWLALFDQYKVDFVLQGHDHAYLRTYPIKSGRVNRYSDVSQKQSEHPGTRYLISVSGEKMYPQVDSDYIEKGFINVATYQIFQIQLSGDQLLYQAFDSEGVVRDQARVVKKLQ